MKNAIEFEKNYLTVADIKKYLCISTTAAYELTHRKDFPVCRLGSSIRVPAALFLEWVKRHTHIPAELAVAAQGMPQAEVSRYAR
ncbi:MAG: helix-turn-helix domain-containing protein [Ruthenibacterium sp.]